MKFRTAIAAGCVCILMAACGGTRIPVTSTMPATKIDIASQGIKRIAIDDFRAIQGAEVGALQLGSDLRAELVALGRFEVLDRAAIQALMQEHQFNASGLVDATTTTEVGKFSGATALVLGEMTGYGPGRETVEHDDQQFINSQTNQTFTKRFYRRVGSVKVAGSFRLIDVTTGRVVAVSPFAMSKEMSTDWFEGSAPAINYENWLQALRHAVVQDFVRSISPYQITYQVALETDGKLPTLEQGNTAARIGEWADAAKLYQEALDANPQSPSAHFNLGIAKRALGEHAVATELLRKAYMIKPCKKYEEELARGRSAAAGEAQK